MWGGGGEGGGRGEGGGGRGESIFLEQRFIEFSCNRTAFWHRHLNDMTLMSEKNISTKPFSPFLFVWQYLGISHFRWPKFGGNTRFGSE